MNDLLNVIKGSPPLRLIPLNPKFLRYEAYDSGVGKYIAFDWGIPISSWGEGQ